MGSLEVIVKPINDEKEIDYRLLRKEAHEAYKVSQWVKNNIND